jgi:hypothetical protein
MTADNEVSSLTQGLLARLAAAGFGDVKYRRLGKEPLMFKTKGPFCQSCGMPLSKDDKGGATEADGTRSTEYCSHCYVRGTFTEPRSRRTR